MRRTLLSPRHWQLFNRSWNRQLLCSRIPEPSGWPPQGAALFPRELRWRGQGDRLGLVLAAGLPSVRSRHCCAGSAASLDWLESLLESKYEIKTQRIGIGKTKKGIEKKSEGQVLNRVVRRTNRGWELEADLRHAELIIEQLASLLILL